MKMKIEPLYSGQYSVTLDSDTYVIENPLVQDTLNLTEVDKKTSGASGCYVPYNPFLEIFTLKMECKLKDKMINDLISKLAEKGDY